MDTYSYIYDTRGNMSEMPHLDNMKWNISNELYKTENGTMEAYYQYSGGQRIRKWVDKGNIKEERIYLGNFEIYRIFDGSSSLTLERQTVHVSDDSGRIAMLETRTFGTDPSPATLERYIYSNHLQSASLELDASGDIISYEEYHPYGTTSYQAMNASINAVAKRYRYTGKERDEESGLYYHGARYYIPWLCRWCAVDPMEAKYAGMSPYNYAFNNPIMFNDLNGADPDRDELPIDGSNGIYYYAESGNIYEYKEINGKGEWVLDEEDVVDIIHVLPIKSKYFGSFGVDFGSFGNGLIDGIVGVIPDLADFLWDMLTDSKARAEFMNAIWQLVSDPLETLSTMLGDKWDTYSSVFRGNGTEQQKYEVGEDIGNAIFGIIVGGGVIGLSKGIKQIKNITPKKKVETDYRKIDYENHGSEFLDLDRMVEQPYNFIQIVDLVGFRREHILNRHRAGSGFSGKTEFPSTWSDDKIIEAINEIANSTNVRVGIGKWDSPYKIGTIDGIEIRVDFYPINHPKYSGKVSTGYPLNVKPNP